MFSIRPMRHVPIFVVLVMAGFMSATTAGAAAPGPVGRGTAGNFAVLGGSTVTNTGASVLTGDLGLSPGTSITGFPPGEVHGAIHQTDAVALQAKQDLVTAYDDAAGRASNATISADLGGQTLTAGVYRGAPSLSLTGSLTLDGQGDRNAVFIFQAPASTLITASASDVILTGSAQACNVVWQVGSSATLGTGSSFTGDILALQSITVNHGATVNGRTLARNAAVTLDQNTISRAVCSDGSTSATTGPGGGNRRHHGSRRRDRRHHRSRRRNCRHDGSRRGDQRHHRPGRRNDDRHPDRHRHPSGRTPRQHWSRARRRARAVGAGPGRPWPHDGAGHETAARPLRQGHLAASRYSTTVVTSPVALLQTLVA